MSLYRANLGVILLILIDIDTTIWGQLRAPNFLLCFVYPKFSHKAAARLLIWSLVGFRLAGMKSQYSLNHWGSSLLQAWLFTDLVM